MHLSKSRLLVSRQCPKRLWLAAYRPDLLDESGATSRFVAGQAVGAVARSLHPEGRLIAHEHDLDAAVRETHEALQADPNRPLFEPAFRHDGLLVRADVLLDAGTAATLVEVKSTSGVKEYHYADAAIQTHVIKGAGVDLARTFIAHVDTSWVYPGGERYAGLLVQVDVSSAIAPIVDDVPQWVAQALSVLDGHEPQVAMGGHCTKPFDCPFMTYCASLAGPQPEYPVELLPGKDGKALARRLRAEGYADLREVPVSRVPEGGKLARVHKATRSGHAYRDQAGAHRAIAKWAFPRYWLDFETIAFAVPIWARTRPYQQIPFQWSCHVEQSSGALDHVHFLDLSGANPQRACAEALLAALGERGVIVAYHAPFERSVLKGLADALPDLAPRLRALLARVVDLEPVVIGYYYHPDMRGSFSIKAVLPTIAPALDYGNLGEVQSGDVAQIAYAEAIRPRTSEERRAQIERALLDYCRRDTEAMVAVARGLVEECTRP